MQEIEYLNEHVLPGQIGNFFVVLSFISAIFSMAAYWFLTRTPEDHGIRKWARGAFYVHSFSVLAIVGTLIYILFNHLYEYQYAFDHVNNAMPMKYVLSAMWEGQEGSFLLWTFWHVVLGNLLIRWSKNWEPWVMALLAMIEVFLASMLLGVYFGDFQMGSNPFLLLRELPIHASELWIIDPNYMSLPRLQDGRGLNALLQNYWMTIHPPTLFLGFAATAIPFVYALAGLWRKDMVGWMRPAIPWAFFGVMILGTGILMGGAWAYEALGFGGFWAWDPVENASLVPWLTLVGAAHLLVINKRKQTSLFTTFFLTASSFILVLYSTFLTRSGVLGESSVHSFVESGILPQLLVYLMFFVGLSTWLLLRTKRSKLLYLLTSLFLFLVGFINVWQVRSSEKPAMEDGSLMIGQDTWVPGLTIVFLLFTLIMMIVAYRKHFASPEQEEALWSREFWLFIGSLVLTIMAIHITVQTSVNVGNILAAPFSDTLAAWHKSTGWSWLKSLSEHNIASPSEEERFYVYHRIQVPLAFVLFILIAIGQFLRYKNTDLGQFRKRIQRSLLLAMLVTLLLGFFTGFSEEQFPVIALVFSTFFALFSNADYALRVLKGKFDVLGASIAHVGFALLIIGAVVSTSRKEVISKNVNGNVSDVSKDFNNNEDLMLYQGDTLVMGEYCVHYKSKQRREDRIYCEVEYFKKEPKSYKKDDIIEKTGIYFRAVKDHEATEFLTDWSVDSLWRPEANLSHEDEHRVQTWLNGEPGEYLYTLYPTVLIAEKGNSREPSIKHGLSSDLYTFIKYTDTATVAIDTTRYLEPRKGIIPIGEEIPIFNGVTFKLDSLTDIDMSDAPENLPAGMKAKRGYAELTKGAKRETLEIMAIRINDSIPFVYPVESKEFRMLFALEEKPQGLELTIQDHASNQRDLLILTAEIFPWINVLWFGCIIMVIGTVMAIRHRMRLSARSQDPEGSASNSDIQD
jgi:cytochrome c-type biogenesis protein CcmF